MTGRGAGPELWRGLLLIVVVLILLVMLPLGLLYAYRAQQPAAPTVPLTQVIADIEAGRVRAVLVQGDQATITFTDGRSQRITVPERDDRLVRAVQARNLRNPTPPIDFRFEPEPFPDSGIMPIVSVLPLLLLVMLIVLAAYALTRARAPQRYELLARLADLRDRGALTDEEFEREKRRLLK